jgi:hypothetical protein
MYTTISGIYENGKIILQENAPTEKSMKVLVTFVEETDMPPNQTTIKALEAAERGEYEVVSLDGLRQQWDEA